MVVSMLACPLVAQASWSGDVSLKHQLQQEAATIKLVRVKNTYSTTVLPAGWNGEKDIPVTVVEFEEMCPFSLTVVGTGKLVYQGGQVDDQLSVKVSSSPDMVEGDTYFVIVREANDKSYVRLLDGRMSCLAVVPVGQPTASGGLALTQDALVLLRKIHGLTYDVGGSGILSYSSETAEILPPGTEAKTLTLMEFVGYLDGIMEQKSEE